MKPLFDPADFRLPAGIAHVCAGHETAALRAHDEALLRYVADKSLGLTSRTAQEQQIEAGLARLRHVQQGDIGFVSNVPEGVAMVAESLRQGRSVTPMLQSSRSSSSMNPDITSRPLFQNAGSEASSPNGASSSLCRFVPPARSMSRYFAWNPG
jgi:hypothetical protein